MTLISSSFRAVAALLTLLLVDKVVFLLAAAVVAVYLMNKTSNCSGSSSLSSSSSSDDDVGAGAFEPLPAANYEVFLSFRGPDVRTGFADHLNEHLLLANFRTFLDDKDLVKGYEIEESLYKAIEDSKVYIPILSPGYASSKWCLRELSHMVRYCNQGKGNLILPIFYMMAPRDVRHQCSYKEAFVQHSKRYDAETINEWKEALTTVGKLKGWTVTESDRQGVIARDVFSRVRSHLLRSYLLVTEELVNINPHVDEVISLLNKGVKVVGIVGMGGLGKSTIAMAVRDKIYTEFSYLCFLRDVRQTLTDGGGILTLQRQIISAIPGHDGNVQDPSQGVCVIRDRVCKEKCLIIIDDVGEKFVFEQILGKLEDFSSGSRFIITTRNKGVLKVFQHEVFEPDGLDDDHSLELFSRHAFRSDDPTQDQIDLSKDFVKVAAGLPLALKVIGSTLYRKNTKFWKEKLLQLKDFLPEDMLRETLMISYLDLKSEEQQIFLDIASVFIGVSKELPFYMWSNWKFYPEIVIDALILKSLIKVTEENKFWMHDCIRDLGRTIIYEQDRRCPWKRSRILSNDDAINILTNREGTEQLEVLKVNMINSDMMLSEKHFEKLTGLRYLQVSYGELKGNFHQVLPNLCWLALDNCSLMHCDTNMKKSIVFIQRSSEDSDLVDDSNGSTNSLALQDAHNLKAIDLWNCNGFAKVPTLTQYKAHEPLVFSISQELEHLMNGLELNSGGVKVVAIVGMGGIGKTTVARALYNEIRGQFDGCCFIEDVRGQLQSYDIGRVQSEIIHSILQSDCNIEDVNHGINITATRICEMKVLIVLDELDSSFQLDKILGEIQDFRSGSRFIITTRYQRAAQDVMYLYELNMMNVDDSVRLFSRHAFGADFPPKEDFDLSRKFVEVAGGHLLTLRVIGSLLFCRDKEFWHDTLERICSIPPANMLDVMMICYHDLSDNEQQIFLDIACFFHGADKAQALLMWDSCSLHPETAIATLIQRSLIQVNCSDNREKFSMHSILREMGKKIVREEDHDSPWSCSRVWLNNDQVTDKMLLLGTDRVKGLRVEIKKKKLRLADEHFQQLTGLVYLEVQGGDFEGNFGNTLPNIRWLNMHNCGSNPIACDMRRLVILHIQGSSVRDDWSGWQNLKVARNLKSIRLHQCNHLASVPDLSQCENLEFIEIEQCRMMSGELHISHMRRLKVLKIVDTNITKITGDIVMLGNLQEITLPRRLVYVT